MASDSPTPQNLPALTDSALAEAAGFQRAGELERAAAAYRTVLEADPANVIANRNMGALAVQLGYPEAALAFFEAVLDSEPSHGPCWLNYIDALRLAGKADEARQVLAAARQHGLTGAEVDALELRLLAEKQPKAQSGRAKPAQSAIAALLKLFEAGRFEECIAGALEMVRDFPAHWIGWKILGVVYQRLGRNADALLPMQKTVELLPGDAEAHDNLGIVLQALKRFNEAEASYRRSLQLAPRVAQTHGNLGAVLMETGRMEEAEVCCREAIRLDPQYAKAWNNLGVILHAFKRLDEAENAYRRALEIRPEYDEALNNLAITLKTLGRTAEAEASYLRALEVNPSFAKALSNLSIIDVDAGRFADAEIRCRRALEVEPDNLDALTQLGIALGRLGRWDEALRTFRRALQIKPDYAPVLSLLNGVLLGLGRCDEVVDIMQRALEVDPSCVPALLGLGGAFNVLTRLSEAEASCRRALELSPDLPSALNLLGCVLSDQQRHEEAADCFRRAVQIDPSFAMAHSNLLFWSSLNTSVDAHTLFDEHLRFGDHFEAQFRNQPKEHVNSRDPDRGLRVGLVSGDFREHAVAHFIEPLLAELCKSSQISLYAYSNHLLGDATTQRLQGYFAQWRMIAGMSDAEVADRIRADGIDILIDLSGHTAHNRLPVFARKPAPIQVSWTGYPGTTGLSAVDYYLSDRFMLPAGQLDGQFIEKIVRLPAATPFLPDQNAPPVGPLPAIANGYVTFGSFNRQSKLTPATFGLWATLLHALPDARMLIGGMPESGAIDPLVDSFARVGVSRERLDIRRRCDMKGYLSLHQCVDLCLDTIPYNGSTTTLHALWMGVPTLTVSGETMPSRAGAQLLGHVGLDGFVARDESDFLDKGVYWTRHLVQLSDIRAGLRERFSRTALMQPVLIAAGLEQALRIMWRRWCSGLPPDSFEVTREELLATGQEATP